VELITEIGSRLDEHTHREGEEYDHEEVYPTIMGEWRIDHLTWGTKRFE
jgi:hypothetical protein